MAQEYITYRVKTVGTNLYATIGGNYAHRNHSDVMKFDNYHDARMYANRRTAEGNWQWAVVSDEDETAR